MTRREAGREGGKTSGIVRRARSVHSAWLAFDALRKTHGEELAAYLLWRRGAIAEDQRRVRKQRSTV
jgi:hypothetical protein